MQTERVTRSRARTMAAGGDTPSLAAMPDKTPATRTTRRRAAAAAATAPPAANATAPCTTENVLPVVLFDVTNDQDCEVPAAEEPVAVEPASEPEAPAAEDSAGSEHAAEAAPADEPPATPAHSVAASPAALAPGATPTGLGLSTLPPMSPMSAMAPPAATPAATPMSGLQGDAGRVSDALHAAVQALGGGLQEAAAPAEELVFRGFGSPVKVDSPEGMAVSIGGAVCPASAPRNTPAASRAEQADATSAASPAALDFQLAQEREVTLEEMMGTPPSDREESPEHPTPTLRTGAAAAGTPVVRTVTKPHPLTPSRQVVLEEEEQDYIMKTTEEEAQQAEAAEQAAAAASDDEAMADPSPAPQQPAARVRSKVVVPSPHTFDPRSLRQLKREVADRMAAKLGGAPRGLEEEEFEDEEEEEEEYLGAVAGGEELTDALGALSLETGVHHGLRGVPTPAGKHTRFDEEGEEAESPRQRVYLRGMPQPAGSHVHFDD